MSNTAPDKIQAPSNANDVSQADQHTATSAQAKHETSKNENPLKNSAFTLPHALADRYELIRALGSGAQGKVYQVKRRSDGALAAIKLLNIDSVKSWKEYTLFHREAEVLASLDIPGIAKFYEACDCLDNDPPYSCIIQEYIDGATLKHALQSGYRFSLDQIYDIALQLIDILEKLHTHNPPVIHRDIKPSNIILQPNGNYFKTFLIDFGAVANPQIQSGGSTIAGTFGYMSPEQNIGRPTPQSDTYALTALLAYMLSGVDPAEMKVQNLRLIIDPYVEHHPPALVQTLRRMLEPDLDTRLADLSELRTRFQDFQAGKYMLSNEAPLQLSPKEFKDRLLSVQSLGESQNLEIWQCLPDNCQNRPKFPFEINTNPRFAHHSVEDFESLPSLPSIASILLLILIFCIPMLLSNDSYLFLILAGILFVCIFQFVLVPIYWPKIIKSFKNPTLNCPPIMKASVVPTNHCALHEILYQSGRKTIATITNIAYIPLANTSERIKDNRTIENHRIETPPTFRIWYKFNPPDDDNPNDIIHCITIHRDPQEFLRIGDSLPILYLVVDPPERNKHDHKTVTSMPYPFPLDDIETADDYIFGKSYYQ